MAKELVVTLPHDLARDDASRRIADAVERARSSVGGGIISTDVVWPRSDHADICVRALGQTIDAKVDVDDSQVVVRVTLPWLLERLTGPITDQIQATGRDALRIGAPIKPGA